MRRDPRLTAPARDGLVEGAVLPSETVAVDTLLVVASAASTWTFFGGHIDAAYARSQGRRDVYLATGPITGLVDAYAARLLGPTAFLRTRKISLRDSICAGDTVELAATVRRTWHERPDARGDEVEAGPDTIAVVLLGMTVTNQLGSTCVQGELTLVLDAEASLPHEEAR